MGVRLGWWRSVYASQNAFPEECFVDELADAAGKDPLAFRQGLLPADHPLQAVLELAGEKAGWGTKLPRGVAAASPATPPSAATWPRWPRSR